MTRVLSRKGSSQIGRFSGEEQDSDEALKWLVIKVIPSQLEPLKPPLAAVPSVANNSMLVDSGDRSKKSNRRMTINPRKILLLLATISSMGTMILIYFTLAINWRGGS